MKNALTKKVRALFMPVYAFLKTTVAKNSPKSTPPTQSTTDKIP